MRARWRRAVVLQCADHRTQVPERPVARYVEGVLLDAVRLAASHVRHSALLLAVRPGAAGDKRPVQCLAGGARRCDCLRRLTAAGASYDFDEPCCRIPADGRSAQPARFAWTPG